jgi:hypothetical protein
MDVYMTEGWKHLVGKTLPTLNRNIEGLTAQMKENKAASDEHVKLIVEAINAQTEAINNLNETLKWRL